MYIEVETSEKDEQRLEDFYRMYTVVLLSPDP